MRRKAKWICSLLLLALSMPMQVSAAQESFVYEGYTYDYNGNAKESPAAFTLERTIGQEQVGETKLSGFDDVCTSEDGRIFALDTVESRFYVFDETGEVLYTTKLMRTEDGKIATDEVGNQIMLSGPEGLFVHEKEQELYIADTGAKRIIVIDLETYTLKRILAQPENLTGVTEFNPSKVAVDNANRIYAVVQSSYEGIVELTADGDFAGYYGVNTPRVSLVDYFWKSIASDEQKAQMSKSYAPAFNNITLDGEGFVMAVTYDSSAESMVFRLNSRGENVLREEGNILVVGDIWSLGDEVTTEFVDIAVTDYGTYALLDRVRGRIFLYDFDGLLLNVFGSLGNLKGQFKQPSSIAWLGDKLVVSDKTLKCIYVMAPTAFGQAVLSGNEAYYFGRWDEAMEAFQDAVALNVNYEPAYSGIGKNYLMQDDYETAMYYFKLGNNRTFYSQAYDGYRGEWLESHFGIIALIFVVLIGAVVYSEIRYHKKSKRKVGSK